MKRRTFFGAVGAFVGGLSNLARAQDLHPQPEIISDQWGPASDVQGCLFHLVCDEPTVLTSTKSDSNICATVIRRPSRSDTKTQ